jgi:hypothetical protein
MAQMNAMPGPQPGAPTRLHVQWPDNAADGAVAVTQFNVSTDGSDNPSTGGFFITLGLIAPPPWTTEEEIAAGLERTGGEIPVRVQGSFYMSRAKTAELFYLLGKNLGLIGDLEDPSP